MYKGLIVPLLNADSLLCIYATVSYACVTMWLKHANV